MKRQQTEFITFLLHTRTHTHPYKQHKKQKLIKTNKAHLNVRIHVGVGTHTGAINLFRFVACFNYYNQPPIIAPHVCSCSCQEQAETFSSVRRETNTISLLPLSPLCSVKAFNQALVYFQFVYYVIVRT